MEPDQFFPSGIVAAQTPFDEAGILIQALFYQILASTPRSGAHISCHCCACHRLASSKNELSAVGYQLSAEPTSRAASLSAAENRFHQVETRTYDKRFDFSSTLPQQKMLNLTAES